MNYSKFGIAFILIALCGVGCAKPLGKSSIAVGEPTPGKPVINNLNGHYKYTDDTSGPHANQFIDVEILPDNQLKVQGEAFWSPGDPQNINNGVFGGVATLSTGLHAVYSSGGDDGCVVTMDFVGPTMSVKDNLKCGGMNVTFMGTYEKQEGVQSDWSGFEVKSHAFDL